MRRLGLVLLIGGCFFEPAKPGGGTPPPAQPGSAQLAAGGRYACSIRPDKSLVCWGDDEKGQLGASGLTSPAPRTIPGSDWASIATAGDFACALSNGVPICWGYYRSTLNDPHPEPLPDGVTAAKLFGSEGEMCAIDGAGNVYCLGNMYDGGPDGMGGRGVHRQFDSWTKLSIGGVPMVWDSLALGYASSCAISTGGQAYCWGNDGSYELGVDPSTQAARAIEEAIPIPGFTFKRAATGSGGSCGITDTDQLVCWGSGTYGDGTGVHVVDTHPWTGITADFDFVCGIREGQVWCFGDNDEGALGDGFAPHETLTMSVYDAATEVVAGADFVCATTGSDVSCWGSNQFGEIGNSTTAVSRDPVKLTLPAGMYTHIAAGLIHTCVLIDGKPYCFGGNYNQQSAPGGAVVVPVTKVNDKMYTQLVSAGNHTCAATGAAMDCWGDSGSIGATGSATTHTISAGSGTWSSISVGDFTSCGAPSPSGAITCVGVAPASPLAGDHVAVGSLLTVSSSGMSISYTGQLCSAGQVSGSLPTMHAVTQIVAAADTPAVGSPSAHVCFIDDTGGLYCFGPNGSMQAGGTGDCISSPQQVTGTWSAVTAVGRHTCAIDSQGALWCWGQNEAGELGTLDAITPPSAFPDARAWSDVSLGQHHMCGIAAADGQVYCWGLNIRGEAGTGEHFHDRPTPVQF